MERLNSFWQDFSGGLHIRLTDSAVSTINEMANRPTKGEIILRQTKDQQFELHRFALMADAGNLGMMSKVARHAVVQIVNFEQNPSFTKFELEIPVASFLSHSGKHDGVLIDNGTAHIPNHMSFHGQLKISLIQHQRPEKNWRIQGLSFEAECPHDYADANSLVQAIKADWTGQAEVSEINLDHLALAATTEAGASAEPSQTGLWHSIAIRPIWFCSGNDMASPESIAAREYIRLQVAQAKELWAKALVRVDVVWQNPDRQTPFIVPDNSFLAEGMVVYNVEATKSLSQIASDHGVLEADIVPYNFNLKVGGTILIDPPNTPINVFVNIPTHTPKIGDANSKISGMPDWLRAIHYWLSNSSDASLKPQLGVIDIYFTNFTDSLVQSQNEAIRLRGGGTTQSSNTAYAHCLLTDRRLPSRYDASKLRWMDYLLAHELGHVLGLKHPYDSDILSDGQLNNPKMTVKAFRWDAVGGAAQSYDCDNLPDSDPDDPLDRIRMAHIMCLFDKVWTDRDFPIGVESNYIRNKTGDIMTEVVRKDPIPGVTFPTTKTTTTATANTAYASALQTCLDKFIDQLTPAEIGEMDENPVLLLFITDPNRNETDANINDYHMGMSFGLNARKSFAVPIYVINKAARRWTILGATVAFASDIYYFLNSPVMHKVDYGTLMDASTPDPAVIDLEMCNLVVNGNAEAVRQVGLVSINPALQLVPNKPAETFKDTKTFEMYLPTVQGDVGYGERNKLGFGIYAKYHSPYFWNSTTDLTNTPATDVDGNPTTLLKKIRTEFFEPKSVVEDILTRSAANAGVDNYLYIHVRLRANHLPANLPPGVELAQYFTPAHTRVYVGLRFPGSGGLPEQVKRLDEAGKWYCDVVAESITLDNSNADKDASHPYVAGFTVQYKWRPPVDSSLPDHFCICAFVISRDQPLQKADKNVAYIDWATVTSRDGTDNEWGISDMDVSPDEWLAISDSNPQWMWQNMDRVFVAPGYEGLRLDHAPVGIHVGKSEQKSNLVYHVRQEPAAANMNVYINRFDKNAENQRMRLNFDQSTGLAIIPAGDTELRSGVFGVSFSMDWTGMGIYSLYFQPYLGDKALDGYNFQIRQHPEKTYDFGREIFDTVLGALNSCYNHFQSNAAKELLDSLKALNTIDIATMTAWPKEASVYEKLQNLWLEIGQKAAADMVILQDAKAFMDSIGKDDKQMLLLMNGIFDHLHFLVILHNGYLATAIDSHNALPPAK